MTIKYTEIKNIYLRINAGLGTFNLGTTFRQITVNLSLMYFPFITIFSHLMSSFSCSSLSFTLHKLCETKSKNSLFPK